MRIFTLVATAAALALLTAPDARANGRFPAANQIVFSPTDPNLLVLRTTFGILFSHDGGVTWLWLCEDVLGISSAAVGDPVLALTVGSVVAGPGQMNGLFVSRDTGCNWSSAGGSLEGQLIKDLVVKPGAPDVVLALTSTYGLSAGAEGGPGYSQEVDTSPDDGMSWSALGSPLDPSASATSIELAASDTDRIYVSAIRGANETRTASLFVSTDAGGTWTERPVPIDPNTEAEIYIAAVDPMTADRVYVRTLGQPSRLLVTSDAGQTFQPALSLSGQMLGFALSPDGSRVYAGSIEDGLFVAGRDALAFEHASKIHVQCLATHGADLWACSDEPSGFIAGVSNDDGATFTAKAHLKAQPMITCTANSNAASQCGGAPWEALCAQLPGCPPDGGLAMASPTAEGGAVGTRGSPNARGCSAVEHEEGAAAVVAAGAFAAMAAWGRRRRR